MAEWVLSTLATGGGTGLLADPLTLAEGLAKPDDDTLLLLADGTYAWPDQKRTQNGGRIAAYDPSARPVIDCSLRTSGDYIIDLSGSSAGLLENVTIQNESSGRKSLRVGQMSTVHSVQFIDAGVHTSGGGAGGNFVRCSMRSTVGGPNLHFGATCPYTQCSIIGDGQNFRSNGGPIVGCFIYDVNFVSDSTHQVNGSFLHSIDGGLRQRIIGPGTFVYGTSGETNRWIDDDGISQPLEADPFILPSTGDLSLSSYGKTLYSAVYQFVKLYEGIRGLPGITLTDRDSLTAARASGSLFIGELLRDPLI